MVSTPPSAPVPTVERGPEPSSTEPVAIDGGAAEHAATAASAAVAQKKAQAASEAKSFRRMAVSSATWTAVGFGGSQVIRVFSSIILTRFIQPEVYGLMDLVTACLVGLHLFSDVGLVPCVVQSPRGEEPRLVQTAWTIQVFRGVLLAALAALIAWPMALLYDRAILAWLLPVVGLSAIVEALNAPAIFTLTRRIERARLVMLELSSSVITLLTTVAVVYLMRPGPFRDVMHGRLNVMPLDEALVWAVVAGGLAGRVLYLLLSHGVLPGPRARFAWEKESVQEILGFAKWIFFSTILAYLAMQTDRLLVPKLTNFETSGLYGRGLALLAAGTGVMGAFTGQVIFPMYSRLHQEGRSPKDYFLPIHRAVGVVSAMVVSGMIAAGPSASRVLYPPAYASVGWILQLLACGAWFQLLQSAIGPVLLATGRRRAFVFPAAVKTVALIVLVAPCWYFGERSPLGGFVGMILGFILADMAMYISVAWAAHRHGMEAWRSDLGLTLLVPLVAFAAHWIGDRVPEFLAGAPVTRIDWLFRLLCQAGLVVALWGGVGAILWRTGAMRLQRPA